MDGRKGERADGWMGRQTPLARIVIDRQEKRYRRCSAGERAIDRAGQTPSLYTEKKVGLAWQIDTCHGVNKVSNEIEGHGVADVRGANLNSGERARKKN